MLSLVAVVPDRGVLSASLFRPAGSLRFPQETPRFVLIFAIALGVLFPALRRAFGGWTRRDFGLAARGAGFPSCIAVLAVGLALTNAGILLVPGVTDAAWAAYGMRSRADLVVYLLWMSPVIAGLGEEVFFRGYVQGLWMEANPAWSSFAAALVFALLHGFQGWVPLFGLHLPLALLFTTTYRLHRDLPAQVFAHALYDVIVFAELWLLHRGLADRFLLAGAVLAVAGLLLAALRRPLRVALVDLGHTTRLLARDRHHAGFAIVAGAAVLYGLHRALR